MEKSQVMIILFIFTLFISSTFSSTFQCPDNWIRFRTKCYRLFDKYETYARASDMCVHGHGGSLVRILSEDEQSFIEDNFMNVDADPHYSVWLGAMRIKMKVNDVSAFLWSGGLKINYTHWYPWEPNNYNGEQFCLVMWGWPDHFATWYDTICTQRHKIICEKDLKSSLVSNETLGDPDSAGLEFEIRTIYKNITLLKESKRTYIRIISLLSFIIFVLIGSICLLFKLGEYSYLRMLLSTRGENFFTKFNNTSTASVNPSNGNE